VNLFRNRRSFRFEHVRFPYGVTVNVPDVAVPYVDVTVIGPVTAPIGTVVTIEFSE